MIEVTLTDDMKDDARRRAEAMGPLKNSISGIDGNYIGFLGEEVALLVLEGSRRKNTFDYDLIHGRKKIDVKTKACTSRPKPHYLCSVFDFNPRQRCDYYAFVRVDPDKNKGYYLGAISKRDFYKKATKHKKGQRDGTKGFVFKADNHSVPVSILREKF